MSEESTSQSNTASTSESSDSSMKEKPRRFQLTVSTYVSLEKYIRDRMSITQLQLAPSCTPKDQMCESCNSRVGKYEGDCDQHSRLCGYCCYVMILVSMQASKEGPITTECLHCCSPVNMLTKRKCSTNIEHIQDENKPNSVYVEQTFTICDYIESICNSGFVNGGFEYSNSQ
ncbi:hypothetical protein CAEBREN_25851 [Caenorhabditis brenneri]|uniref:Uncharacterized protein n=1 Tax=Caenorhabditis brenneri TaxID=135651 RepID=G0MK85_CAEBE|nr:hypothetical protein CAEBREN_25851 [Caenorhabditis brenneri]